MSGLRLSSAKLSGLLVALIAFAAFCIRVFPSYGLIFKGDWVKYASADAYYQMRLVDNLAHNFPNMSTFDPYLIFPGGSGISGSNFFVYLIAGISSVFGLTTPDQHAIDVVGVFLPPVIAAITVIVVFFIGKELFGRWGGVLSAAMLMILPGEYLSRSKLGFTDYHVLEVLLTATAILFLILAIKAARRKELDFGHLLKLDWATIRKPVIYSLLAGLFLGLYGLTWTGAPLFIFVIFVFMIVQSIIDHLFGRSTGYLSIIGILAFLLCLIIVLPGSVVEILPPALLVGMLALAVLGLVSRAFSGRKLKPAFYPVTVAVLGLAGVGIFYLIYPGLFNSMLKYFAIFYPSGPQLTTVEMQPLISSSYGNPLTIVWNNYNVTFFLGFISMAVLLYLMVKRGNPEKNLFLVWSIIILIINLGQRRFGYYYGVNVSLLTGYLSWLVLDYAYSKIFTEKLKQQIARAKEAVKKKARRKKSEVSVTGPYAVMSLVVIIVFFVVYFWSIEPAMSTAGRTPYAPADGWYDSLLWMKENTPEPFGDLEAYYELEDSGKYLSVSNLVNKYDNPGDDPDFYTTLEESYPYPDSAYGVLSWWDYGYWITRIAHRLPNANPGQDPRAIEEVAAFMTAQDEESANVTINGLDSKYVVIDYETAYMDPETLGGKFYAVITWAGKEITDFFDVYLVQDQEDSTQLMSMPFFYPEYYRSMAVRLYNFDCQEYIPDGVWVISYQEVADSAGNIYKLVNDAQEFETYEEAEDFVASQETDNYRIASMNPLISCTPLEALEHYTLIHSSEDAESLVDGSIISEVKVFEYTE